MKKHHYFAKPVIAASGSLGFMGEGYKHYLLLNILTLGLFGLILRNWVTFQSKTSTATKRIGNAQLASDGYSLEKMFPKCVGLNFWKGWMVNNFSLSGPGLGPILRQGKLYKIKGELHLSIMLVGDTAEERTGEARLIVLLLKENLHKFSASKIFLNWNISCPNTGHNALANFLESFIPEYAILSQLELPIIVKVGWQFPIEVALRLQELKYIYGFTAINTILFNELPDFVKEKYFKKDKQFGHRVSPLDKHQDQFLIKGRGGVSGHPIRPYALAWIREARRMGITKPIIGGGGIMNPYNVWQFKKAGANAISLGSCISLRLWNLPFIILTAKVLFRKRY